MNKETVINRLKEYIESIGLTNTAFSNMAGIDASNFSKMLNGTQNITTGTLKKIAEAHGISYEWLLYGTGTPSVKSSGDNTPTPANERIAAVSAHLNINLKELSEKCGYDRPQAFYDVQKCRTRNISVQMCDKIKSVFPVFSRTWLLTGEGSMFEEPEEQSEASAPEETRPRLPVTVAAGSPHGFGAGISLAECEQIPVIKALPPYDFTIIITGDSMEPEYKGGDEIAIKKVKDIIQWGGVYLVDTADGAFIKRLYDDGERFRCVSYNPEYPDFYVEKEAVFGVYKVVGLIRF